MKIPDVFDNSVKHSSTERYNNSIHCFLFNFPCELTIRMFHATKSVHRSLFKIQSGFMYGFDDQIELSVL